MKEIWKEVLICLLLGLAAPAILMEAGSRLLARRLPAQTEQTIAVAAPATETATAPTEPETLQQIQVLWPDGSCSGMELETYLVGVVLAEMPASFEEDALRAQSVAARTYAAKAQRMGGKHGDGSICTNDKCCQAYLAPEDYLAKGGMAQAVEKVRHAVEDTEDVVLTYGGQLIEATYFSCSGGRTEDAKAVGGADFPYLRSVSSPGEEEAEVFQQVCSFPKEKVELLLGVTLPDDKQRWLGKETRTSGGGIETLEIGGKTFTGTELRTRLGLRSTFFTARAGDQGLTVDTRGYGHRVGLSQYGADAMAASGKSWQEILGYYYQGAELQYLSQLPEAEQEQDE